LGQPESETPEPEATSEADDLIVERTPEPTATPGIFARKVTELVVSAGLARKTFLGLSTADWINFGISLGIVIAGYMVGSLLIQRMLPIAVKRTPSPLDDEMLKAVGTDLRWTVVLLSLHFATTRLLFFSAEFKAILADAYFVIGLAITFRIIWRVIDVASRWYRKHLEQEQRLEELDPVMTLLVRLARLTAVIFGLIILLSHFGINVTGFAAALGIGGLALSLAAQDTLADTISGFIILVDRPFRVGDRIEIQGVGTWGDVVEIGLRTTRIRTRDNRMVIVPNSIIGKNQVINYTYPDPRYRIETHVGIGYGSDIERVRRIITETVRQVEGVLPDRPVDALYVERGDSAMIFRVRWWIESYVDTRRMFDRVNTALEKSLAKAGIDMPFPTQDVNIKFDPAAAEEISGVLTGPDQIETETQPKE
jgi:small-conductance mechanosensitive channel